MKINRNFHNLEENYLFATVSDKAAAYRAQNPDKEVISMGIGDVTLPLPEAVVSAMERAAREMGEKATFRGYCDYAGYGFLREAICEYYAAKGVELAENEVFVGDGAKSDLGNISDIFARDNKVLIPDPVYPVYVDTNIMSGRVITYVNGSADNNFLPMPEEGMDADIIHLCSPNNPTGAVYGREQLKEWVDFAIDRKAVILFDAAYEAFVRDDSLPTSIFEIEGAKECAIEFGSLSKTAGFTGTRCGYTVIPKGLSAEGASLNRLWYRRQSTKFNGVSYVVQRSAEAVFTPEGLAQSRANVAYYLENTRIIMDSLNKLGIWFTGGENSPYIWLQCPKNMKSWDFFDHLLENANVIGTPGAGIGDNGEGFFRLTAFGGRENVAKAMERFEDCISRV